MYYKISLGFLLLVFLFINCSGEGESPKDVDTASTLAAVVTTAPTGPETNESTVLSCPGGHIDSPNCTKCASNFENKDNECLEKKSESKPSPGTGGRILLIIFACLLTVVLILALLAVYGRLNQQRRRHSLSNPGNTSDSSNLNPTIPNRFNNILRSIGLNNLNKRGRFNFFSISNNNNNTNSSRQTESSRTPLNENPDEALLFDDPYADGGFNNQSANPYKSLTLAVT